MESPRTICWGAASSGVELRSALPEKGWAAGGWPRGCLLPQGACPAGCTPHFSFVVPKEKRAVHGPKEKTAFGRNFAHACKVAVRGSAYRCLLRFGLAFGHAILFCENDAAVPWRMVRRSSGCKDVFDLLLFPRVPLRYALPGYSQELLPCPMLQLSSTTGQRQRKSAQHVSQTSPGQRVPQGQCVSVSDFYKEVPAFPRRRQEVCAGADRPAEHFFFSTGRGAFSF